MKTFTEDILLAPDAELVCWCHRVSKKEIVEAIKQKQNGAKNLAELQQLTGACTGGNCKKNNPRKRCCSQEIYIILRQELGIFSNI